MKEKVRQKINQAHDAYRKDCLSRKEVAIDFLKGHLPKKLVEILDLMSLEKEVALSVFAHPHSTKQAL